jgi:ribonuclease BN (tRNA processing enzyme)
MDLHILHMNDDLQVRINGVLPDVSSGATYTSMSVFYQGYHLLVDAGDGVQESIKNTGKSLPDAILITNARKHHTSDLQALAKGNIKV